MRSVVFVVPGRIETLTGGYIYDRRVLDALGVKPEERIAGFVHIGRPAKPTEDRPRPPLGYCQPEHRGSWREGFPS